MPNKPYTITIGLETHIELSTKSKMFSGAANDPFHGEANTHLTPVCIGMPGTLPVPNLEAVKRTILFGLAFGCQIPKESKFDRKHYFYPDLPKGYQISQFDQPLCQGGEVVFGEHKVGLTRIHLEEDAGKLLHSTKPGISAVDLNRAGVPLMEVVSEPEITSPAMAREYLQELRLIARHLAVSEADMEKGQLRCDANVSIIAEFDGQSVQSYISEIKNLNSFRSVERALIFEAERIYQELLADSAKRTQTQKMTVGWNEQKGETILQRSKEGSADYRYFPEPDIPPLRLFDSDQNDPPLNTDGVVIDVASIRQTMPALPGAQRVAMASSGLPPELAETILKKRWMRDLWNDLQALLTDSSLGKKAATLLVHDATEGITAQQLHDVAKLSLAGEISSDVPKKALAELAQDQHLSAQTLIQSRGWQQLSNETELQQAIDQVIAAHPQPVADYKAGKEASIGFLVGQVMQVTKGQANPAKVQELLRKSLA